MSKRTLDIHDLRDASKRVRTIKEVASGVDEVARVQTTFAQMVDLLKTAAKDYGKLKDVMAKTGGNTVANFLDDIIQRPFKDTLSYFVTSMKELKALNAALRVEVQNLASMQPPAVDPDLTESESDLDEEVFGAGFELDLYDGTTDEHALRYQDHKLEVFRSVQRVLAANEGMFADFFDKLNGMNILVATSPQLRQLESSLDHVNDTLGLCDDFFAERGMVPTWVRFSSRFASQLKRMVERVDNFTTEIAEPLKAIEDATVLGTTLKTTLALKALTCAICFDAKLSTTSCSECFDANICGECYSSHILKANEEGLRAKQKALNFACLLAPGSGCKGVYSEEVMRKMITVEATHALYEFHMEVMQQEEVLARKRKMRRQVDTMTPMDRIYEDEFNRLSEKIGNFCPTCLTPFADFVGCAAVSCTTCAQKFCALCGDPCPRDIEEHEHVRRCRLQHRYSVDEGEGVFVSLDNWKQGRAHILNGELVEYLQGLPFDGPLSDGQMLKEKLLKMFANPDAPLPPIMHEHERARRPLPRPVPRPTAAAPRVRG